jgi:alpha-L-fucosidase
MTNHTHSTTLRFLCSAIVATLTIAAAASLAQTPMTQSPAASTPTTRPTTSAADNTPMNEMWGSPTTRPATQPTADAKRTRLFDDGNYGMFIHFGPYAHLAGQWKGTTYYGIGEWILRTARISPADYRDAASNFNPYRFDAKAIAKLAKDSGMKWIIITSKHHDGFAMFKSADPFNIVDHTPLKRDLMKELSAAARSQGLGFGFYYSHNQDWTAPGGSNGPSTRPDGSPASFEQYFREKCLPQVKEICTNYGKLDFIWFDTPGRIPKPLLEELVALVRKHQPGALLCSRVGHGMGDYESLGDMEVPHRNHPGLWEACDTTNDSWGYVWYDQNFKSAKEILHRLVATVGRGGSYLLNIGPNELGQVPDAAQQSLLEAGAWIKRHPEVVYSAGASPWQRAMPWGDITTAKGKLNLVVFDWPADRKIYIPHIAQAPTGANPEIPTIVRSVGLRGADGKLISLPFSYLDDWIEIDASFISISRCDPLADVIEVAIQGDPKGNLWENLKTNPALAVHPNTPTTLLAEFAKPDTFPAERSQWTEKFGEWKSVWHLTQWKTGQAAEWEISVARPGLYQVSAEYRSYIRRGSSPTTAPSTNANPRIVLNVSTDTGGFVQNQQGITTKFHTYPLGQLKLSAGRHTIAAKLVSGDGDTFSLSRLVFTPVRLDPPPPDSTLPQNPPASKPATFPTTRP